MSKVSKALGDLTPEQRTLLEQRLKAKMASRVEQIPKRSDLTTFPLSFSQQQMWLFDQMSPNNSAYNVPGAVRLKGVLNVPAWEQSLLEILRRHEALRANFGSEHGNPIQTIVPADQFKIAYIDLRQLPKAEQDVEAQQLVLESALQPFNLSQEILVRTALIQIADDEHVFVMTMHHIVFDGWSLGVFVQELCALYAAFSQNQPSLLPELPIQYADYAVWQRGVLSGDALEQRLAYWREQLKGSLPVLELPTDRSRPANQTYVGATQVFALPASLLEQLKALSRQVDATLFMTMLAAFYALLYRYTGQTDLLIGSPVANRTRPELENLIGYFVNTLELRTNLSGDESFRSTLAQVRDVTLGAYAHQDVPFEILLQRLKPERDLSRSPFFQAMFVLQNAPVGAVTLSGLSLEPFNMEGKTAKYDLTLTVGESDNGLSGVFEYNTDLFEATTIQRLIGHFQTLLEGIVANPDTHLADLPLLTAAERQQVLVEWNNTQTTYPENVWIHQLFERQVGITPDSAAVTFEGETLTYVELNRRANQLAHVLQDRGVVPDTLVGVCMERSLEMVVSLYAILKAGGAYVPMDPDYPADRLAYMLSDSAVSVLLTQDSLADRLPEHQAHVIRVDSEWEQIAQKSSDNLNVALNGDNLAYMIYTSGSTGRPKGAMNTHKGIFNRLMWMQNAYMLKSDDVVMQKTPFSFDVSVWEFFWPLMFGAHLFVAQPGGHRDSAYLVKMINAHQITTLHFVPSMLAQFVNERDVESCISLRRVICSGEALPLDLQSRFFARLSAELHNLYGPTEAAVDVTYWQCDPKTKLHTVPIGRPIANTQIYLLDSQLQPVPIGVAGELHIGGINLARGYHNRPELTAERFIANPFQPGTRLYKTGDSARFLVDGTIEYLGRLDFQVKLRGLRIELGEIESTLNRHPAIRECAVIVREDIPGDKRIVAYYIPVAGEHDILDTAATPDKQPVSSLELRRFLQDSLPDYMIPSAFVMLDMMPVSPNGKLERRALPPPDQTRATSSADYAAPSTPLEELVAGIWSGVLGIEQISLYDNFFDLGGHSLMAVQVMAQLEERTGRKLDPALMRFATVGQLAATLSEPEPIAAAPTASASEGRFMGKLWGAFRSISSRDNK